MNAINQAKRREISEDRAKLEELRAKCKIREETYKIEIDKLRQKLDKIRYKFEQQHKTRQNSQEMQRLKDENVFLKQQVQYQQQQLQQSFKMNNILQSSRENSATKRAQSSRSTHDKNQHIYNSSSSSKQNNSSIKQYNSNHNNNSGSHNNNQQANYNSTNTNQHNNNNGGNYKKVIASDMELVKIAQHKIMKENKGLKKRVDLMQSQMKELYDILLDEKMSNTQIFQTNSNIHQVMNALKQESGREPEEQQIDMNYATIPFDYSGNKQNQLLGSSISNIRISGERSISPPLYQTVQNTTYGEVFDVSNKKIDDHLKNNPIDSRQQILMNSSNSNSDNLGKRDISNFKSPQSQPTTDQPEQKMNDFQEKIEMTKSKFIDKIKNVFLKHQQQNEIFETNNKKMQEITKQLFEPRSKSKEPTEKQQGDEFNLKTEDSISSSVVSSVSSAFIVKNETGNSQKNGNEKNQLEFVEASDSSSHELVLGGGDDANSTLELQQDNNQNMYNNEQIIENSQELENSSSAVQRQMDFLKKDYDQESEEQMSADFDYRKKMISNPREAHKSSGFHTQRVQPTISKQQNNSNLDTYYESTKLNSLNSGKGKTKSMQNELNVISFNDTAQKNFKKESVSKGEEFRSLKEQFSSLIRQNMNQNVNNSNNNTQNNLNNTTGMSAIANNYIQFSGYDGSLTSRRCDPVNQFQVAKNYTTGQNPSTSSTTNNYSKQQYNKSYQPSTSSQVATNQNYANSIELNKNQDNSSTLLYSNPVNKYSLHTSRKADSNLRNPKQLELDSNGHSTQLSPQKELITTSRQRDELYLNYPTSTQSQSLHVNGTKKENKSIPQTKDTKNYEIKVDHNIHKASNLTNPLFSTQNEKITDEYIKQIIQQYKTPKKTTPISTSSHHNPNQYYQQQLPNNANSLQQSHQQPSQQSQQPQASLSSTQQFMVPHQKKPSQQTSGYSYERRDVPSVNMNGTGVGGGGGGYIKQQPQTTRNYDRDTQVSSQYNSYNQNINNSQLASGAAISNINTQSSPNRYSKNSSTNNKMSIQSTTPSSTSNPLINNYANPPVSSYSKDMSIYNCYFNNNSPINKKTTNIQPPLPTTNATSSSNTNRESLNLNHKRQQSCGGGGVSGVNKYNLKLNLTSLVTPKSSQMLQSDRQNSDRTSYNRLFSKNSAMMSSNISPKYSPHSSQTASVNRFIQK